MIGINHIQPVPVPARDHLVLCLSGQALLEHSDSWERFSALSVMAL